MCTLCGAILFLNKTSMHRKFAHVCICCFVRTQFRRCALYGSTRVPARARVRAGKRVHIINGSARSAHMEKTNRFMHHPMSRKETVSKSPVSTSNRGDDNRGDDRGGEAATMFASAARVNATGPLLLVPATVDGARGVQLSLDASSALSYVPCQSKYPRQRARATNNQRQRASRVAHRRSCRLRLVLAWRTARPIARFRAVQSPCP